MSIPMMRRLDRLNDRSSRQASRQPITLDEVTAADVMSGRCFAMPRAWTLEDLVAAANELDINRNGAQS